MAYEARVIHLQRELVNLGFYDSLRALNWMIETMNANNGYARDDGRHYYYHLVDATQDLINHGVKKQSILTACILHDAVEDIKGVTVEGIASLFGEDVAFYVKGVTKDPTINYKKGENVKAQLDEMLPYYEICLIKTADRKHNFATLGNTKPEKELRKALETEKYFLPFFKQARKKYPEYSAYFHSAKTTIVPHLEKIKKYHRDVTALQNKLAKIKEMLHYEMVSCGNVEQASRIEELLEQTKAIIKGDVV